MIYNFLKRSNKKSIVFQNFFLMFFFEVRFYNSRALFYNELHRWNDGARKGEGVEGEGGTVGSCLLGVLSVSLRRFAGSSRSF